METKQKGIPNYKEGERVNDLFVVRFKKPPRQTKNNKWFFELKLQDGDGDIMFKYWGSKNHEDVTQIYDSIKPDDVVKILNGRVDLYMGKLYFSISKESGTIKVLKTGEFNPGDFLKLSKKDPEKMFSEVSDLLMSITESDLKKVARAFLTDESFVKAFKMAPGAMYRHHGWIHGLLEHTLNLMKICEVISKRLGLNRDLLLIGAFLHDLGKIREFEVTSQIKVSEEGNLLGHIVMGVEMISQKLKDLDISKITKNKILHLVVSHHGKLEYGSPKTPMFPEALALHKIDELDSGVTEMKNLLNDANTEDSFTYNKNYGNIYLK